MAVKVTTWCYADYKAAVTALQALGGGGVMFYTALIPGEILFETCFIVPSGEMTVYFGNQYTQPPTFTTDYPSAVQMQQSNNYDIE